MRKMKKINGYLVVKFNARELREYSGTFSASFARYVKGVENSRTTSSSL